MAIFALAVHQLLIHRRVCTFRHKEAKVGMRLYMRRLQVSYKIQPNTNHYMTFWVTVRCITYTDHYQAVVLIDFSFMSGYVRMRVLNALLMRLKQERPRLSLNLLLFKLRRRRKLAVVLPSMDLLAIAKAVFIQFLP